MDQRMGRDLDRYITGDYGERQFSYRDEAALEALDDDDGLKIINHAKERLEPSEDEGDILAIDELDTAADLIRAEYTCKFCGKPIAERNSYCRASCAKADAEGL